MVCPSVCLLSQFRFNVPVLTLNSGTLDIDIVLLYTYIGILFITHDESSPTAPIHMAASNVRIVSHLLATAG